MRKHFACFCVCVILVWSAVLLRFGFQTAPRLLPHILQDVDHLRLDRVCAPLATIFVNSAPWHASLRQVIRETWGHPSVLRPLGLGLVFGVGQGQPLQLEMATHGDVLLYPGEEDYRSLPRKVSWLLRRVESACDRPFVVKMDDDVFVNVYALKEVLLGLVSESSEKKLWCLVWEGMPVVRSNHSKWFLSRDTYSDATYPIYCSGAAYVLSAPALRAILQRDTSENEPRPSTRLPAHLRASSENNVQQKVSSDAILETSYNDPEDVSDVIKMSTGVTSEVSRPLATSGVVVTSEDVYITGLLAGQARVAHVQLGTRFAFESINLDRISDGRTVFSHLGPDVEEILEELWDSVQKYRRKNKENESDKGL